MSELTAFEFSPFNDQYMIQALRADGSGLRLAFQYDGVRYAHAMALVLRAGTNEETIIPWCCSLEGNDCDAWPSSPPLQNLSLETQGNWRVALLLGMAGRSHWSASFAVSINPTLQIELACRAGSEPVQLGSQYFWDNATWKCESHTSEELLFRHATYEIACRAVCLDSIAEHGFAIHPVRPWNVKPIVWKYEVELL